MNSNDGCVYVYNKAEGIRCGYTREAHRTAGLGHSFVEISIAKHPFEPLPSDSGICRVCDKTPSHAAHSNVTLESQPVAEMKARQQQRLKQSQPEVARPSLSGMYADIEWCIGELDRQEREIERLQAIERAWRERFD